MEIIGDRIYLRVLFPGDVGANYLKWVNDEETMQFTESKSRVYCLESLKEYVRNINKSSNGFLFGIFVKKCKEQIGNIKIGSINQIHKFGAVGILVGNKSYWGKGYGTESLKLVTKHAFEEHNLNKLIAGMNATNVACHKMFMNAGYREVGRYKRHLLYNGDYIDQILVEKCKADYRS